MNQIIDIGEKFQREAKLAKEMENINVTKDDISKLYDTYISDKSQERTKLTIQCFGNQHGMNIESEDKEECYKDPDVVTLDITDIKEIREKCGYYPFPYTDTSKL